MTTGVDEEQQTALLDLGGREFNQMWVDEGASLFVANNPLHWKAHKLQVLLSRLDKQAARNPAQFNSANYLNILNQLTALMEQINGGVLDAGKMVGIGDTGAAAPMGEGNAVSMDPRISADNPLAR